jgi:2-polyprenyl-6-methoxyphenol hydroxylase-like FAD-dependent oxidoreductase
MALARRSAQRKGEVSFMTNLSSTDVFVVGAGPVGLTLALDLTRRGITCRIIDKLPMFPVGTRARGIGARTQEIFEDLGVLGFLYHQGLYLLSCQNTERMIALRFQRLSLSVQ